MRLKRSRLVAALDNWEQQQGSPRVPAAGQPRADWYPDPWDPSRVRYWDGTAWTQHSQPAQPPATWGVPATGATPTMGSLRTPAWVVRIFLGIVLALAIVAVLSDFAERGMLARMAEDPAAVTQAEANGSDVRQIVIALLESLFYLGTAIAFLVWFRRAYRDRALDRSMLRHSQGWTIGAWFVPFLNLVRPKQIMDDIWRASGPTRAAYGSKGRPPVPFLLHAWWALFLLAGFLGQISLGIAANTGTVETVQELQSINSLDVLSHLVDLPTTILALLVVTRVTERILDRGRLAADHPA